MQTEEQLRQKLNEIDNKGYGAYKSIKGGYKLGDYELYLDYIQGDPFAAPSKGRIRVPMDKAGFPDDLYNTDTRRLALEDYLARRARNAIRDAVRGNRGSGKSGSVSIDAGRQEVLERTACVVSNDYVELRFEVGMPAKGRKVLGRQAEYMLTEELPEIAGQAIIWKELPKEELDEFVDSIENQAFIRSELENRGLIAFIANGSILPRQSGASDQPLSSDKAIPFESPESMKVSLTLPNPHTIDGEDNEHYEIEGMGIAKGITLIVGGGYHGKSTLLNAIELGIYPHIPHDGREYVVTNPNLVKAIIKQVLDAGASKVYVFDHTCDEWRKCYNNSGIEKAAKEAGATVAPGHTESYYQSVEVPQGKTLKEAKEHELLLESDVFINVPILKDHSSARMTIAMKNLMGVVWDRGFWHRNGLHQCIADFASYRQPDLNIVDAYRVMLRNGPRGVSVNDVTDMKYLIMSDDIVATDAASAKIFNPKENVPHINMGDKMGYGEADLSSLKIGRIKI